MSQIIYKIVNRPHPSHTNTHTHSSTGSVTEHSRTLSAGCVYCDLHLSPYKHEKTSETVSMNLYLHTHTHTHGQMRCCMRYMHARFVCEGSVCQWDVCGGPSGHPCNTVVPVKCCQRGHCGLPWRLKACCAALPAQAVNLRKGNLGRSNGGVAPKLFTEPSTGPAPPTIYHMRTSVCVVPVV